MKTQIDFLKKDKKLLNVLKAKYFLLEDRHKEKVSKYAKQMLQRLPIALA